MTLPPEPDNYNDPKQLFEYRQALRKRLRLPPMKNPHAVALGRKGGSANTKAQNKARARNAKLGGWPKGRKRKK